ncbi:hypothetical protein BJY00DRAFT_313244 [Aspergillus carlsbadensis]|nr:hypothetical protein BJY00DRAFT_313244 [Aspergillus carlsbadensis]
MAYGTYQHDERASLLPTRDEAPVKPPSGTVSAFATFGLGFTLMWTQALIRWVADPVEFRPAPVLGPDKIEPWRLVALRVFEALSVGVLVAHVWFCLLRPGFPYLRRFRGTDEPGQFTLDGRHVIGGLVALCADGFLNCQQYIFMWNAHSINLGVWAQFLPFHNYRSSSRYAESLLWGPPMYVYFCAGYGILGCKVIPLLRRRLPSLTNAGILTLIWLMEFGLDFVIENTAIRLTHAYGFAKTYGPLTLFAGKVHQFPIYESACVASIGCAFTIMRWKALQRGYSPVEAGYEAWPERLQTPVRTFAVIGFCAATVLLCYHIPLNWLGVVGESVAEMPSYMKPGPVE